MHIDPQHLEWVRAILRDLIPRHEVWAFGSRIHGRGRKPFSDLDLAVISERPLDLALRAALRDAFSESDLPFQVDVVDWATTSAEFRAVIEREHETVQEASAAEAPVI